MRNEKICKCLLVWSLVVTLLTTPVYADNESSIALPQPVESSVVTEDSTVATETEESVVTESSVITTEESSQITEEVTALSEVILSIQALPEVDEIIASDEEQIIAIRKAYNDLLADEKTKVWNIDKLNQAEEKILLLKESSGYSYTFTITEQTPTLGLLIGFTENEGEKTFILTSPSGVAMEASMDKPELTGDGFHAAIVQVEAYYEIRIDKAEQGNWLMTTKEPVSFSVLEFVPDESSTIVEESSNNSAENENADKSEAKEIYEILLEKAMTKEGQIVGAVVISLILIVIITLICKRRKNKKTNKKKKTEDRKEDTIENVSENKKKEESKETNEEESKVPPVEMTEEDKIRAQIELYMRKNNYGSDADTEKEPKVSEVLQRETMVEKSIEYLEVEEIEHDVTLVEYADSAVGPVPEKKEESKPRRRQSFFTEDRFGN